MDDETLPITGGNGGGSGSGGNASQWSSSSGGSGGGIWEHSNGHLYGNGPGQGDDPLGSLGDPNALYGDGYGTDADNTPLPNYMEKLAIILDNAVASIGNTGEDLKRKAVLKHREALLMEIGDMTQQGGFYNRMAAAMHGIYDLANNHPIETRAEATTEGGTLATQILADTDAVKVEIYNATLLAAVNSVFVDKYRTAFTSADQAEYRNMVSALMELSRTYAALNPTAPDDKGTSTTPDFLDSLWRAQKVVNDAPLSMVDMRTEMQRGVKAIGDLLDGVQDPLRAIQFVNNLIQAATNVESLKDSIHDAKFLRELVEFGFEYAKLNPTGTASTGSDAINTFLDTLWKGGDVRQAQGGLSEFFEGFTSKTQRIKLLNFEDNLLKADGLLQGAGLQDQKRDATFIGNLVGLGSAYAALNPSTASTTNQSMSTPSLFLNTLWQTQNTQEGANEFGKFVNLFNQPEQKSQVLNYSRNLLSTLDLIQSLDLDLADPEYLAETFSMIPSDAFTYFNSSSGQDLEGTYLPLVWSTNSATDLRKAADLMQRQGGYLIADVSSTLIASINGGGSLATSTGKKFTIAKSTYNYINIIAATVYGEGTFDPNYENHTVKARSMQELQAIGAVILNRKNHVLEVENDLKWFADEDPNKVPFKNRPLDQQILSVVNCKDIFNNIQFDAIYADKLPGEDTILGTSDDWKYNKYDSFIKNDFFDDYEKQSAKIALLAATQIGYSQSTPGVAPLRKYPYIFYKRDYLGTNPNNDRADSNSRVLLGTHYFWRFLPNRIKG